MNRRSSPLFGIMLFLLLSLTMSFFTAAPIMANTSQQKVYDYGELLSDKEEASLESLCGTVGSKRKIDIVIVTLNDPDITDSLSYLKNFYTEKKFGYDKELGDTVLISVDMVNRDIYVRGHGICETYIDDTRATQIAEKSSYYFTDGDYAEGFEVYVKTVDRYMGISPLFNPESLLLKWYVQLAIAVIVGGIATFIAAAHANPDCTTNSRTYLNASNTNLPVQRDDYIRTTMSKVKKPEVKESRGNSGGGRSSSGGGSTGHAKF